MHEKEKIKEALKERYGGIAREDRNKEDNNDQSSGCCSGGGGGCCDSSTVETNIETKIGYSEEDLNQNTADASFGLGCGNPKAIASLKPGETVLDLGCGAGFDLLLASREVGESGYLIGVDMTPEMIEKAKANAAKNNLTNIDFYLADIEDLPLEDNTVDVIISNCVINLTPDKEAVYREALRVLKPGGRIAIADVLKAKEMPEKLMADIKNYIECIAGAITKAELKRILTELNYSDIEIKTKANSDEIVDSWSDEYNLSDYIFSSYITARKPGETSKPNKPKPEVSPEEYAKLANALGNPHRIEILKILAARPADDRCMVGNIVDKLPISQSTVSQHLKTLKAAGWIIGQTDGPKVCYCLNDNTANQFKQLTDSLLS